MVMILGLTTLSEDATYEMCRALADRGADYGYDVYRRGVTISAVVRSAMLADDESAQGWLEAFDAALALHMAVSGETWRY